MIETATDLLAWGASLHYPQIVLSREPRDVLQAGEHAWHAIMHDGERVARLEARRERWMQYEILVPSKCQDEHQD